EADALPADDGDLAPVRRIPGRARVGGEPRRRSLLRDTREPDERLLGGRVGYRWQRGAERADADEEAVLRLRRGVSAEDEAGAFRKSRRIGLRGAGNVLAPTGRKLGAEVQAREEERRARRRGLRGHGGDGGDRAHRRRLR